MHIARILFLSAIAILHTPLFAKTFIKEKPDAGDIKLAEATVRKYFHNSEIQRGWAWELLSKYPILPYETVLDFGCLDGKITAQLSRMTPIGSVVGVDTSPEFVHFAKRKFPKEVFPNLEFCHISANTIFDFMKDHGKFDRITAFSYFDYKEKPQETLEGLRNLLKTEGKLLMVIPVSKKSSLFHAIDQTLEKYSVANPWGRTAECPEGECLLPSMQHLAGCKTLLKEAGYKVLHLQLVDTPVLFYDASEAAHWLWATFQEPWNVPASFAKHLFRDIVKTMCEQDPELITSEGYIKISLPRIHVVACLKQTKSLQDLIFIE